MSAAGARRNGRPRGRCRPGLFLAVPHEANFEKRVSAEEERSIPVWWNSATSLPHMKSIVSTDAAAADDDDGDDLAPLTMRAAVLRHPRARHVAVRVEQHRQGNVLVVAVAVAVAVAVLVKPSPPLPPPLAP